MCSISYCFNNPCSKMGLLINPTCKTEWHLLPEVSPTSPLSKQYISHFQAKQKACSSNVIYMTTTKTNLIYPTSIQIKTQSNCLLIRHVSASHFYRIFCMNFCHNAGSWSQSNRSMTQNKPSLAQLCLKVCAFQVVYRLSLFA